MRVTRCNEIAVQQTRFRGNGTVRPLQRDFTVIFCDQSLSERRITRVCLGGKKTLGVLAFRERTRLKHNYATGENIPREHLKIKYG